MAGRKKDPIWNKFLEKKSSSGKGTGLRAICKKCGTEIQGLVQRLKQHVDSKCKFAGTEFDLEDETNSTVEISKIQGSLSPEQQGGTSGSHSSDTTLDRSTTSAEIPCLVTCGTCKEKGSCSQHQSFTDKRSSSKTGNPEPPSKKLHTQTLKSFVVRTTSDQKLELDKQIAKSMFATNTPFRWIENLQVKKTINMLRPGYQLPSRSDISGKLLDEVYEEERKKCFEQIENRCLCMSIDGWSNVHQDPIVCITITDENGKVFLYDSIDTSGNPHTAEYLSQLATESIRKCEREYSCSISSLVTDNAANMVKMRSNLSSNSDDVLTYGCAAHFLNLLSKDIELTSGIQDIREQIVHVVKYFRNIHSASALYKQEKGNKLVLPQDVRWNSLCDCIQGYLSNWSKLFQICEDNKKAIDPIVRGKVTNLGLKNAAEDLLKILKPVAVALDRVQRNGCTIAEAVEIWKELEQSLKNIPLDDTKLGLFKKRYGQALLPCHFLAYMLDPRLNSFVLTKEEKESALDYAKTTYPNTGLLPVIIKIQSQGPPFVKNMFSNEILKNVTALQWWNAQASDEIEKTVLKITRQLFTARASSSGVERVFSTFGFIHSKLRNKLGTMKASKLTFLFKSLNDT